MRFEFVRWNSFIEQPGKAQIAERLTVDQEVVSAILTPRITLL